jgi:hypothetical protein
MLRSVIHVRLQALWPIATSISCKLLSPPVSECAEEIHQTVARSRQTDACFFFDFLQGVERQRVAAGWVLALAVPSTTMPLGQ